MGGHAHLQSGREPRIRQDPWDIHGAQQVSTVGVWVNRHGGTYPDQLPTPEVSVTDLRDLPAALAGLD